MVFVSLALFFLLFFLRMFLRYDALTAVVWGLLGMALYIGYPETPLVWFSVIMYARDVPAG
jgi:hypothetical protein